MHTSSEIDDDRHAGRETQYWNKPKGNFSGVVQGHCGEHGETGDCCQRQRKRGKIHGGVEGKWWMSRAEVVDKQVAMIRSQRK
ncbi:hypothetical protein [uncultured Corynebacterium sp.]|uniref:hypothetical protein n=1 Tax=uncultured Corynebacterium sp. TaxID=159447 RepID=UPI0025935006|nr:hypothetical protein [uncultured Corynebacterium sp.]